MTAFKGLGLSAEIQQALEELGFEEPTAIQEQAIPELLGGHDVIGKAGSPFPAACQQGVSHGANCTQR